VAEPARRLAHQRFEPVRGANPAAADVLTSIRGLGAERRCFCVAILVA